MSAVRTEGRAADLFLLLAAAHATRHYTDLQLLDAANRARMAGDDASANLLMAVLSGRCES